MPAPSQLTLARLCVPQDHVVACTGGMVAMGPLTAVTAQGFNQAMHDVRAGVAAAKTPLFGGIFRASVWTICCGQRAGRPGPSVLPGLASSA